MCFIYQKINYGTTSGLCGIQILQNMHLDLQKSYYCFNNSFTFQKIRLRLDKTDQCDLIKVKNNRIVFYKSKNCLFGSFINDDFLPGTTISGSSIVSGVKVNNSTCTLEFVADANDCRTFLKVNDALHALFICGEATRTGKYQ